MNNNFASLLCALALALAGGGALRAQNVPPLKPGRAANVLLTIEGKVEVGAVGGQWRAAETNQLLLVGERVRTGARSRATIRLSDLSVLRMNELTTLEIRLPDQPAKRKLLDLKSGSLYFFNREKPAELQFQTPLASGAVRGTEFSLAVADNGRTVLTLIDGEVSLSNALGAISLGSGEQGVVEVNQAPAKTAVLNAINVIQWSLYYPGVLDVDEAGLALADKQALTESLAAYRSGDLLRALSSYPAGRQPASDGEKVYLAALLLAVGQVEQTQALLNSLPKIPPVAHALLRLIALVKREPTAAFASGQTPPATAWLVESYYLQSRARLADALEAAKTATRISPSLGFAWARVAELEFSFAHTDEALAAVEQGLAVSPRNAEVLALKGFLLAAQNNTTAALAYFDEAMAVDGALGNAWLGRGLCRIRRGDARGGREDLQVAATLEPQRALLRSYLGKAFSQTWDGARAEKELQRAKELDPNDPTAWLYSALLWQQENRINEGVNDLEKSKQLNDNRAVYRSRLLLDQDRAVRSANLAALYRDAGMADWSVREATKAVNSDYGNYSAHLFLANSYDALRDPKLINLRYETPWFSELLLANLLTPIEAGSLSQTISQQEYSRLFEGNHLGLAGGAEYLSSGDWSQYGSQYGIVGNTSYALDDYYLLQRGQRPNNDLDQLTASAKIKQQITPEDSLFLQALYYRAESGDLAQYYNQYGTLPNVLAPSATQRVKEVQEPNLFLGYHHEWQPGVHTLLLGGRLDDTLDFTGSSGIWNVVKDTNGMVLQGFRFPYSVAYHTEFTAYTAELQQIWQQEENTVIIGARYQSGESTTSATQPDTQSFETDLDRLSGYGYYYLQIVDPLLLMAGVSYDRLNFPENATLLPISAGQVRKDQISPKAGIYWTPFKDTTLRGVYTRSLGGLFYDTSVRLEPSQIAGFNQAFRSIIPESVIGLVPGSAFDTFGVAFDQRFKTRTYLTAAGEILFSKAQRVEGAIDLGNVALGIPPGDTGTRESLYYRERSVTLSLNQLLGKYFSVGASYRFSDAEFQEHFVELTALSPSPDRDESATLQQVNLFANFNHASGLFAQAGGIWSRQSNFGYSPDIPGDDFWQVNAFVGYRFLRRQAELRVGLLNITDRDYRLNPLNLYNQLPRHRTLAVSFKFYF